MYLVEVKSTVEILQNFVAFSEYMNFKELDGDATTFSYIFRLYFLSISRAKYRKSNIRWQ